VTVISQSVVRIRPSHITYVYVIINIYIYMYMTLYVATIIMYHDFCLSVYSTGYLSLDVSYTFSLLLFPPYLRLSKYNYMNLSHHDVIDAFLYDTIFDE